MSLIRLGELRTAGLHVPLEAEYSKFPQPARLRAPTSPRITGDISRSQFLRWAGRVRAGGCRGCVWRNGRRPGAPVAAR
jgi:hypothetical protein